MRHANESSSPNLRGYSLSPEEREVEARRASTFDSKTLIGELDLDSAREFYYLLRERQAGLDAKAAVGELSEDEGWELHELGHQALTVWDVWALARADELEEQGLEAIREVRSTIDEIERERRKDLVQARREGLGLSEARQALDLVYLDRSALDALKLREARKRK